MIEKTYLNLVSILSIQLTGELMQYNDLLNNKNKS